MHRSCRWEAGANGPAALATGLGSQPPDYGCSAPVSDRVDDSGVIVLCLSDLKVLFVWTGKLAPPSRGG